MTERIDVSIEHRHAPPHDGGRPHPNTCPGCGSHYRDDELDVHLRVCPHCLHHFPVHARDRIRQLVDEGSFAEEAAELRWQLAVMEFGFMGGSMGRTVGEKFARACEGAVDRGVPLVSVTASGGARMQEGILSLMQLPKTVCAVSELHDAGS